MPPKRKLIQVTLLAILGVLFLKSTGSFANSYDRCNGILAKGIYNKFSSDYDSLDVDSFRKWLCSSNSGKNDDTFSLGLTVPIKGIPVSLNMSNKEYSEWRNQNCSDEEKIYYGSKSSHIMIQRVDENIVRAWENCMQDDSDSRGLVCTGKETQEGLMMTVKLKYGMKTLKNFQPQYSNLSPLGDLSSELTILNGGGSHVFYFKINDFLHESVFTLNASGKNVFLSCEYIVPKRAVALPDECEEVRMAAFRVNLINSYELSRYREFNLMPIIKDGRIIGDALCD